MRPELTYLAASGVALAGATYRDGKLPNLTRPLVGTVILVIVAAASSRTAAAPVVDAFGKLLLLGVVIAVGMIVYKKQNAKGKK